MKTPKPKSKSPEPFSRKESGAFFQLSSEPIPEEERPFFFPSNFGVNGGSAGLQQKPELISQKQNNIVQPQQAQGGGQAGAQAGAQAGGGAAAQAGARAAAQAAAAATFTPAQHAQHITDALTQAPPVFVGGPSAALPNGGAFNILQSLNAADLIGTLQQVSVQNRQLLFDNTNLITSFHHQLRIKSAIRSVAWGQAQSGIERLNLLDQAITAALLDVLRLFAGLLGVQNLNPNNAALVAIFTQFQQLSRNEVTVLLQTQDQAMIQYLRDNVQQAPAADQQRMTNILDDFLGQPAMGAEDFIDVNNLRGLQRTMAMVYNTKGQYIASQAQQFNADSGVLAGFMQVESGSQAFSAVQDRPLVRFEVHVFWRQWGQHNPRTFRQHFQFNQAGQAWTGHRYRVNITDPWRTFHGNQQREWEAVDLAANLANRETAYQSMSMGMGQIMGFNHNNAGFANAVDMFDAFNRSERSQMDGILNFINANQRLLQAVQNRNYNNIARYYNGGGQIAVYGPRIRSATLAYDAVTQGKRHVFP